jgi:hypothetical protein
MHTPYVRLGAASVAMVLGEMEGNFPQQGSQNKQQVPALGQHADFLVYANFIQENAVALGHNSTENEGVPDADITINEAAKNRFLSILNRLIKGNEGLSRQERIFVHRFWSEMQKTPEFALDI